MGVCCKLTVEDGVFHLILDGDGDSYLSEQSMADLTQKLDDIRRSARSSSKVEGLVTTFAGGPFCNGVNYDDPSSPIPSLARRVADAARRLFEMPFPTAAAVTCDAVRTSLALALVLAHDEVKMLSTARIELPEVRDGRDNVPPFVGAMLRDKTTYPRTRAALVLQSQAMTGADLKYWYVLYHYETQEEVVKYAAQVVTYDIGKVSDGEAYIITRKSFFPESWKAVTEFLGDGINNGRR